jgi:hypothetical protein
MPLQFVNYHQQRLRDGISQHTSRRPGCNCLPCMGGDLAKWNTRPWPWRYSTYVFTWSLLLLCTFQQSTTQFMQLREVDMQKPKPPPPPPPPLPLWVPSFMCLGYSWLCACTCSEFLLMQMFVDQLYNCVCAMQRLIRHDLFWRGIKYFKCRAKPLDERIMGMRAPFLPKENTLSNIRLGGKLCFYKVHWFWGPSPHI